MPGIFVSYVREDQTIVDRLVGELRTHGAQIWLDRTAIKPGERWADAIRKGPIQIDRRDLEILLHGTTNMLYGLRSIIDLLGRENLPAV